MSEPTEAYRLEARLPTTSESRGVGDLVVAELVGWARHHAPDRAFLGLFAAAGTDRFYRRHGFERHEELEGMFQVVRREG